MPIESGVSFEYGSALSDLLAPLMTAHLRRGTQPGEPIRWARRQLYDTAKLIPKATLHYDRIFHEV